MHLLQVHEHHSPLHAADGQGAVVLVQDEDVPVHHKRASRATAAGTARRVDRKSSTTDSKTVRKRDASTGKSRFCLEGLSMEERVFYLRKAVLSRDSFVSIVQITKRRDIVTFIAWTSWEWGKIA
jgi:hypothetical protein